VTEERPPFDGPFRFSLVPGALVLYVATVVRANCGPAARRSPACVRAIEPPGPDPPVKTATSPARSGLIPTPGPSAARSHTCPKTREPNRHERQPTPPQTTSPAVDSCRAGPYCLLLMAVGKRSYPHQGMSRRNVAGRRVIRSASSVRRRGRHCGPRRPGCIRRPRHRSCDGRHTKKVRIGRTSGCRHHLIDIGQILLTAS
jgi:hypothetical protein